MHIPEALSARALLIKTFLSIGDPSTNVTSSRYFCFSIIYQKKVEEEEEKN